MAYLVVIADAICGQSYVNWTYEDNDETDGRKGLMDIHLKSAIKISNEEPPILHITSVTKKELEGSFNGSERDANHVSSFVEACNELKMPLYLSEEDSIIKIASMLKWKKIPYCILTGNSFLFDKSKRADLEVFMIKDSNEVCNNC